MNGNKPPQELRNQIEPIVISIGPTPWQRKEAFEEIMTAITSHMQAGLEYAIGQDLVDYGDEGEEYKGFVNDEKDEERRRAAEWLLGSKENV